MCQSNNIAAYLLNLAVYSKLNENRVVCTSLRTVPAMCILCSTYERLVRASYPTTCPPVCADLEGNNVKPIQGSKINDIDIAWLVE